MHWYTELVLFTGHCKGDELENEMDSACSMHGRF